MQRVILICILALFASINCMTIHEEWSSFKQEYAKEYATQAEENSRFNIFIENLAVIKELSEQDESNVFGITQFSDLSPEEFKLLYTNTEPVSPRNENLKLKTASTLKIDIPENWDWRTNITISPPREQYFCMASWAFAAVGAIEAHYTIKHQVSYNLSEQQIIDCDIINGRCFGSNGTIAEAYNWLAQNGGLEKAEDYPYFGVNLPCAMSNPAQIVKLSGYKDVAQDEQEIAQVLYNYGPVSTSINNYWLQFYKGGILKPKKCAKDKLNHHIVLVGYGTDPKEGDYWIGKNSLGTKWGEQGFFRIQRGIGACGLNLNVQYPLVQ